MWKKLANLVNRKLFANLPTNDSFIESVLAKDGAYVFY